MSSEALESNWPRQKRGTAWTRTLTGFAASAGFDAANVDLLFEVRRDLGARATLASVTKSGGGITVLSSSSCTVTLSSAQTALIGPGEVWYQLTLIDTTTGERYPLQFGRIPVVPWVPAYTGPTVPAATVTIGGVPVTIGGEYLVIGGG